MHHAWVSTLNMEVTAEGIETEAQAGFFRCLDCDYLQGYLFGRPMTRREALVAILRDQLAEMQEVNGSGAQSQPSLLRTGKHRNDAPSSRDVQASSKLLNRCQRSQCRQGRYEAPAEPEVRRLRNRSVAAFGPDPEMGQPSWPMAVEIGGFTDDRIDSRVCLPRIKRRRACFRRKHRAIDKSPRPAAAG